MVDEDLNNPADASPTASEPAGPQAGDLPEPADAPDASMASEPADALEPRAASDAPRAAGAASAEEPAYAPPDRPLPTGQREWYILKVQSNREDSIRDALMRRIKIEGLEDFFGEIIIPVEMVTEFKNGKKRVVKRKLYPGYIVVNMELNDDTWYLVRDTHGIGDFTGAGGKPSPMPANEVARIVAKQEEKAEEAPKLKIGFQVGDRVKINEGTFENFEGDVDSIDQANGRVTVMINIFGRSTPVELEYWQLEAL